VSDPEDDDGGPEVPLEGATCAVHGERMAVRVCPVCGKNACMQCWHAPIARCHACLVKQAPTLPPLPWEDPARNVVSRFFATLGTALAPDSSAPGFAREADTRGGLFWLLSFVPLALAGGVIPYTHTLVFGFGLSMQVIGHPDQATLAIDVAQAALMGLLTSLVSFLGLALPYVSLSRAYADRGVPSAPVRLLAYRGWLVPFWLVLYGVLPWIAPQASAELALLLSVIPLVMLFGALRAVARLGSGAGPFATLAIVLVPLSLMFLSRELALYALQPLLPDVAALTAAAPPPAP
jgi:hypothetical protein